MIEQGGQESDAKDKERLFAVELLIQTTLMKDHLLMIDHFQIIIQEGVSQESCVLNATSSIQKVLFPTTCIERNPLYMYTQTCTRDYLYKATTLIKKTLFQVPLPTFLC